MCVYTHIHTCTWTYIHVLCMYHKISSLLAILSILTEEILWYVVCMYVKVYKRIFLRVVVPGFSTCTPSFCIYRYLFVRCFLILFGGRFGRVSRGTLQILATIIIDTCTVWLSGTCTRTCTPDTFVIRFLQSFFRLERDVKRDQGPVNVITSLNVLYRWIVLVACGAT
jgi:hypothetical protein